MTITAKDEISLLESLVPAQLSRDARAIFRMLDWSHIEALSSVSQFGNYDVQEALDLKISANEVRFEYASLTKLEPSLKLRGAQRDRSANKFDSVHLTPEELLSFCNASFGSQLSGKLLRRPYASAGGLYPVSVFAVPLTPTGCAAGNPLHYLPESKQFQMFGTRAQNLKSSKLCFGELPRGCCTSIFYVINIQRAIAKYRLRGIKHAFIEVGEMVQTSAINARRARLGQRCWSAHNEAAIKSFLGLHPNLYEIGMVQLLGKKPRR